VQNPLYLNVSLYDRVKNQITSMSDHLQPLGTIFSRNALIRLGDQVIAPYAQLANERTCALGIIASDKAGNLLQILP
jgi:precorrin-3B methylase